MNILFWLKKILRSIFKRKNNELNEVVPRQYFFNLSDPKIDAAVYTSTVLGDTKKEKTKQKGSNYYEELQKLQINIDGGLKKIEKIENVLFLGFVIVLIMVATILVSLLMWSISSSNLNLEKLYNFQIENIKTLNLNQDKLNNQKDQLNNLNTQGEILKNCLNSEKYHKCF